MGNFNVLVTTEISGSVDILIPRLGKVTMYRGYKLQLKNADAKTIEYLRTLRTIGIQHQLNKVDENANEVFDYLGASKQDLQKTMNGQPEQVGEPVKSMQERVGDYVLTRGKHKGKKLSDLTTQQVRMIANRTKDETERKFCETYLMLVE